MKFVILSVLMFLVLPIGIALSAEDSGSPMSISLTLDDVDVSEALAVISQKAQAAVLGDPSVKGKVTCSLSDVTVEEALGVVCGMNKLQWVRAYASPDPEGKLSAAKLFEVLDALKELGGSSLICVDPKSQTETVFVPGAKPDSIDLPAISADLNLKPVYLIRAEVDPKSAEAAKQKKLAEKPMGLQAPPADPGAAAQRVWDYFSQMPSEQRFQVMHELGHMLRENMTPEEREAMRERFRRGGFRGEGRPPRPDRDPHPPGVPH